MATGSSQRANGFEPSTFSLEGGQAAVQETSQATPEQQLTSVKDSGESAAYPTAYPPNVETAHGKPDDGRLTALAAELAKLSPEDRAKLAALLTGGMEAKA